MTDLSLDPATCALVAVDLQHGIVSLETAPYKSADVVANVAKIAKAMRVSGGIAVFVRVTNASDGGDELVPQLGIKETDIVVTKRQWGAFYGTDLELHLRRRCIRTIVLCGISTNIGVESTARDAYERGFDQVFVEDACAALNAEAHKASIGLFGRIGRVRSTEQVLNALGG
jgi:nicotinamidase-related amidase